MPQKDRFGYALTAGQPSTAERYDEALAALLRMDAATSDAFDATVADEPSFVMGQVARAYLRCLSSEGPDAAEARAILADVDDQQPLTDRERRHIEAARAYANGDLRGASDNLLVLSAQYPYDALALTVGHQLDFFQGEARTLRSRIAGVLPAWDRRDPWYGYLLGMYSFGLEECHEYDAAEEAGMEALARDPRDVWAHHAIGHTYEMRGMFDTGIRFYSERRPHWSESNFLFVHNAWHEALFRLETDDIAGVLAIYDESIHNAASAKVAMEMLDATALLWRLHLAHVDVGDRWQVLADDWAAKADEPWYVFNDFHAVMTLVGAGRIADAQRWVRRLENYLAAGDRPGITNVAMTREVGLPLCQALVAFGEARYADAVGLLMPIRSIVHHFGGSNAQRDVVARTLLEAAFRSGDIELAGDLVSERLSAKERSPYNWLQMARVCRAEADDTAARSAETTAAMLRGLVAA